jgi:hypothetical protein
MNSPSLVRWAYSIADRDVVDLKAKNQSRPACVAAIERMFFGEPPHPTVSFDQPRRERAASA